MKVLVTGAAGFIGSHLSTALATQGNDVHGVDNFSPYYAPELKRLRVKKLLSSADVRFSEIELSREDLVKDFFRKNEFDSVIHLAAHPGIRTPLNQSRKYITNNIEAFTNVLGNVTELGIATFLYASSSSVYGNSKELPFKESSQDINPVSIYGATKRSNEILAATYTRESNTRARGLRFFTVYGPWGRPDMAYLRLINAGLRKTDFTMFGDGSVKRDFTYISDIINQIVGLLRELNFHHKGFSDIVNIGGGHPYSLNDLVKTIEEELGTKTSVVSAHMNPSDTRFTCADTTLQQSLTGFVPSTTLAEGIRETVKWARDAEIFEYMNEWINSTN